MSKLPDVAIIGGGVIGCSIAYYLARRGARVTVLERGEVGRQASGAAAGMLTPLAEASGPGPGLDLGMASLRMFEPLAAELREESGLDVELRCDGSLLVALTEAEEKQLRQKFAWQSQLGLGLQWLDRDEVRRLSPAVSPDVRCAIHCPNERHINSLRLAQAFAQAAARHGASFLQQTEVLGLTKHGTHGARATGVRLATGDLAAGHVVLAAGSWSGLWERELGMKVPVFPVRGQMIAIHKLPSVARHIVFGSGYIVPRPDGTVLVGATQENVGFDTRVTAAGLAYLTGAVARLVPSLSDAAVQSYWAGLRPGTPDNLPLLGPAPRWQGLTLATGHFRKGILLSPATGHLISQLLLGESPSITTEPFDPGRFAGG